MPCGSESIQDACCQRINSISHLDSTFDHFVVLADFFRSKSNDNEMPFSELFGKTKTAKSTVTSIKHGPTCAMLKVPIPRLQLSSFATNFSKRHLLFKMGSIYLKCMLEDTNTQRQNKGSKQSVLRKIDSSTPILIFPKWWRHVDSCSCVLLEDTRKREKSEKSNVECGSYVKNGRAILTHVFCVVQWFKSTRKPRDS